jgi:hypothetical protein
MPADVFEILASTPDKIRRESAGLTPRQLKERPAPAKWSAQLVLAHLLDVEENCWRSRAQAMVEQDNPFIVAFDQEARVAERRYDRQDARRTLARFIKRRQANLKWLRKLRPADWKRTGQHHEAGTITLENLVSEWAVHDLGHLRQILEIKRHFLLPRLGTLRMYYPSS